MPRPPPPRRDPGPPPTDSGRGGAEAPGRSPVVEIVTFRLRSGSDEASFLAAARATGPGVAAQSGFLRRNLLRDADGLWTDQVERGDLTAAETAARAITTLPEFGPFVAFIDMAGLTLRHVPVVWSMGD